MDMKCELMLEEFRARHDDFVIMKDVVLGELNRIVKEQGMLVDAVEGRVKTEHSLAGKLELKGYKYKKLSDITDLVGTRIVTFYEDEVDILAENVCKAFEVDWENSVDKRELLEADKFGYMSLHYICRIPESLYSNPDHPAVNEYRFEIQMRTTLQHVWATVFHDIGYKSDVEVPSSYVRKLNRLAGLLELADAEFHDLRDETDDYRDNMRKLMAEHRYEDASLDGDSWAIYLETKPFSELGERVSQTTGVEIVASNVNGFLELIKDMGFTTIGEIERAKANLADDLVTYMQSTVQTAELDILAESAIIRSLLIVYIYRSGWGSEGLMRYYLGLHTGTNIDRARRQALRTFNLLENLLAEQSEA